MGGDPVPGPLNPQIVGRRIALESLVESLRRLERLIRTERRVFEQELKELPNSEKKGVEYW